MDTITEIALHPGGVLAWMFVGFVFGSLAAWVMRSRNYHPVTYMIVGMFGAVIGGFLLALIMTSEAGLWGSLIGAILGAHIFIAMFQFLGFGRSGN
jgi:uncharacterized membrane protein YeaQ/YmgE (transglycosylase-associated protein family)